MTVQAPVEEASVMAKAMLTSSGFSLESLMQQHL